MDVFNTLRNKVDLVRGTDLEKKVKEATSNENWGASSTLKKQIAEATFSYHGYQEVMPLLWKRLSEDGRNWRIVFKALELLEDLLRNGSDRVVQEARDRIFQIRTLQDFHYIDNDEIDRGSGIREKSKQLVDLVNDNERLNEMREIARKNADKYFGVSNDGMRRRSSKVERYDDYWRDSRADRFSSQRNKDDDPFGQRRAATVSGSGDSKSSKKKKKKKKKKVVIESSSDDSDDSESSAEEEEVVVVKKKKKHAKKKKSAKAKMKAAKTKLKAVKSVAPSFGDFDDDPFSSKAAAPAPASADSVDFGAVDDDPFNPRGGGGGGGNNKNGGFNQEDEWGDFTNARSNSFVAQQQQQPTASAVPTLAPPSRDTQPQRQRVQQPPPQAIADPFAPQAQAPPQQQQKKTGDFFDVFSVPVMSDDQASGLVDMVTSQPSPRKAANASGGVDPFAVTEAAPAKVDEKKQPAVAPKKKTGDVWEQSGLIDLDALDINPKNAPKSNTSPMKPDLGLKRGDAFGGLGMPNSRVPPPSLPNAYGSPMMMQQAPAMRMQMGMASPQLQQQQRMMAMQMQMGMPMQQQQPMMMYGQQQPHPGMMMPQQQQPMYMGQQPQQHHQQQSPFF